MNPIDHDAAAASGAAAAGEAPVIFVTGASRSGTTMLARMLGAHSAVLTLNELHYFGDLWHPGRPPPPLSTTELTELGSRIIARHERGLWSGRPLPAELGRAARVVEQLRTSERNAAALFGGVLNRMAADAGRRLVCEQTPRNIFYAERLLSLYPAARVVHMVRDPRAVLASQKHRWRLRSLGAGHLPRSEMLRNRVNYHPFTVSRLWRSANTEALRLRDHPRFLLVAFEALAAAPEEGLRRICRFLDIGFEPAMTTPPRWGSSSLPHSAQAGVARETVENWRGQLSSGEVLACERMTAALMTRLGYATDLLGKRNPLHLAPSVLSYPLHLAGVVALNPARAWIQLRAVAGR